MSFENKKTLDAMHGVKKTPIKSVKNEKGKAFKFPKITGEMIQTIALSPKRHISKIIALNDRDE